METRVSRDRSSPYATLASPKPFLLPTTALGDPPALPPGTLGRGTHSPSASSSQISKWTSRSYLQWRGPGQGLVSVLSLVAGTGGQEKSTG